MTKPVLPPEEALLRAWMQMTVCIRGNRILSRFSFNEILICNLLLRDQEGEGAGLTATELCRQTRLLKSQMNHLLSGMEKEGLIHREKSRRDQRSVRIRLREEALPLYHEEHEKILAIVGKVRSRLGPEDSHTLTALLEQAVAAVNELQRSDNIT